MATVSRSGRRLHFKFHDGEYEDILWAIMKSGIPIEQEYAHRKWKNGKLIQSWRVGDYDDNDYLLLKQLLDNVNHEEVKWVYWMEPTRKKMN